jgi:predicted nucleic acid-binding protein
VILVDTNVLVDLINDDPIWADWSQRELDNARLRDDLAINDIIFAELAAGFASIGEIEEFIRDGGFTHASMPHVALFEAAKAFQRYRAAGGMRLGVLPDFFIGAHAVAANAPLISRDAARFRFYFPGILLIAPD